MELDHLLDDDSFKGALAFLDSYDRSLAPLGSPSVFVTVPVAVPELPIQAKILRRNAAPARPSTRNRGKKKAELERLRQDSKMLESRLARLKKPGRSLDMNSTWSSGYSEDEGMDVSLSRRNALSATWKMVAVRQYQRRKQSEIMNRDLKRALANQHKIARAMETLFTRRTSQQDMDLVYDAQATVAQSTKTPELDQSESIAVKLLAQVQQLHVETDAHLTDAGVAGPDPRSLRTLSSSDQELGAILETSSCALIPLSIESADRVLAHGMAALYENIPNVSLKSIERLEDSLDKSYVATIKSVQCAYDLQVRAVTRKFASPDRVVFAWTSIGVVANKGLRFEGQGMMVLERATLAPTQSALLKTWHRTHAELVEPQSESASEIEMLKAVGMKALSQNVAGYFAAIENTLLQAAVDKSDQVFVPAYISW